MTVFIYLIVIYFVLVFILSRLIIPHLGFREEKIPELIPVKMRVEIDTLKLNARSAEEFLRLAYDYLGLKFRTGRFTDYSHLN